MPLAALVPALMAVGKAAALGAGGGAAGYGGKKAIEAATTRKKRKADERGYKKTKGRVTEA